MFETFLLTSIVVPLLAQAPAAPLNPTWKLDVATPTFHSDSQKTGAAARFGGLVADRRMVIYPYAGQDLCMSSSAVTDEPDDAGFGWRVQITPIRNDDGLVAKVEWQRLWYRGEKLPNGLRGTTQVTFKPGQKIMFDYMAAAPTAGCPAIGMGLEIGLQPEPRPEVVEANMWLVRTAADGSEHTQRQTLRLSPGASSDFYFDDVRFPMFFFNAGSTSVTVRTTGRLTLLDVAGGTSTVRLDIGQYVIDKDAKPAGARGGSSGFDLKAGPADVLAVQVPKIGPDAERMSLRLQLRQIR